MLSCNVHARLLVSNTCSSYACSSHAPGGAGASSPRAPLLLHDQRPPAAAAAPHSPAAGIERACRVQQHADHSGFKKLEGTSCKDTSVQAEEQGYACTCSLCTHTGVQAYACKNSSLVPSCVLAGHSLIAGVVLSHRIHTLLCTSKSHRAAVAERGINPVLSSHAIDRGGCTRLCCSQRLPT